MRFCALFAIFLLLPLAACNTIEGFGQDMQAGGQNIEDTADANK